MCIIVVIITITIITAALSLYAATTIKSAVGCIRCAAGSHESLFGTENWVVETIGPEWKQISFSTPVSCRTKRTQKKKNVIKNEPVLGVPQNEFWFWLVKIFLFFVFIFLTDVSSVNFFGEFQTCWLNGVIAWRKIRRKLLKSAKLNRALFDQTLDVIDRFQ